MRHRMRGIAKDFVAKLFWHDVQPTTDYFSIPDWKILQVSELVLLWSARSRVLRVPSSRIRDYFHQQDTQLWHIEDELRQYGSQTCHPFANRSAHSLDRDIRTSYDLPLGEVESLMFRTAKSVKNKLVRNGVISKVDFGKGSLDARLRAPDSRLGNYWSENSRSLHTEVTGIKSLDEKNEAPSEKTRINSTSKRQGSRGARPSVGSVHDKPNHVKSIADFKLRRHDSQRGSERRRSEAPTHQHGDEDFESERENVSTGMLRHDLGDQRQDEVSRRASAQAMALLRAALDEADEEDGEVAEELQRSLRVGIVGAPNAGKSLLTNALVGTKVSAVSRKTNTTHREHLGVFTKDDTQLLYYDTPGLHLDVGGSPLRVDAQHRVRNAWEIADSCEALVVLVDAERQIRRPDTRVQRLVEKLGGEKMGSQKRVLCLNKVDLIEQKRLLLPLAKQFEDLLGYDRIFMISSLTGSGVKDVTDFLISQAVLRPWDEDPETRNQRDIALEIVREHLFDHLHEELPHTTKQKLVSWKVLKDGSLRIQQVLLVPKKEHQKILVGKNGAVIGEIGIKARKELQEIFGVTVHLVLDVKLLADVMGGNE